MTAQAKEAEQTPAAWLKQVIAPHRRLTGMASGLVIADVIPATGFAAGLALAVGNLSQGLIYSLPGAALAVGSLFLRAGLSHAASLAGARAAHVVKGEVRHLALDRALGRHVSDAQAMTAVHEGIEALDGHMSRFVPARTAAALSPLILILVAAVVSPFTAGILIFTLLPFVLGMALTGMAAAAESRRQFQALERLSGLFVDRVRALPMILAFQAEEQQGGIIEKASQALAQRTIRVLRVAFLSSAILEFFSALAVALVAVYCGFNLLKLLPFPAPDQLSLTQAFFLLALAPEVYAPMRRLSAAYHDRQAAEAAVPHLKTLTQPETATPLVPALPQGAPSIQIRNLAIAYDGKTPVLSLPELDIAPGQSLAIMGASGSGKSSLLHLFLGLSPLSEGEVWVNDLPLSKPTDLSAWIAWAGQNPVVVPGTLEDNIALANRGAPSWSIMRAAASAGFSGTLSRQIDERGGGLSGGERRRLGLARAFLKPAPLLLMDEPTANLDAASEAKLLPVIKAAMRGRTCLIATHSEAVAALADKVIRL